MSSLVCYLASFFSGSPVFSCPPGCRLLPSRVSSLALQGVVSCPTVCLLLPSRVSSLALRGIASCPPGYLLLPSRVSSLALQGVFSCPPGCHLLHSRVSSLALQDVFSCLPGCLLLHSKVLSLALQGALQDGFCNGVVLSDVAKPGELASFYCCQQGLLLSSKGVHLLSHMFLVFNVRNAEESPEAFRFKCLYASLLSESSSRIHRGGWIQLVRCRA